MAEADSGFSLKQKIGEHVTAVGTAMQTAGCCGAANPLASGVSVKLRSIRDIQTNDQGVPPLWQTVRLARHTAPAGQGRSPCLTFDAKRAADRP